MSNEGNATVNYEKTCDLLREELRVAKLQVRDMKAAIQALVDDRQASANHPNPEVRLGLNVETLIRLESFLEKKEGV